MGATAAVLTYNAVSRVMATMAARCLKIPWLGYFDDFGVITAGSTIQDALGAFAPLNGILGLDLEVKKSEWGAESAFSGVTVHVVVAEGKCEAQLSISVGDAQKLSDEVSRILGKGDIFLAHMRKLVGELNFAQTALMGKKGE